MKKTGKNMYLYLGILVKWKGKPDFRKYLRLKQQKQQYERQAKSSDASFPVTRLYPCYEDKSDTAGSLPLHYFFQDLYVAQRIFLNNPAKHIDIGSRIDGFVAQVAAFREIEILDIRPMNIGIPNVKFKQCDIMESNDELNDYSDSLSCLHALEHFGLGRYGDPIDYYGYLKGFNNIAKMLKQGGKFYFSVPLGEQRTEFHAHRVFSLKYLLEMIMPVYEIDNFSYINDQNEFHEQVEITEEAIANNCGCHYGCAIFELRKK